MTNSSKQDLKDCTARKMATAKLKSLLVFMYLGQFKQDTLRQAMLSRPHTGLPHQAGSTILVKCFQKTNERR